MKWPPFFSCVERWHGTPLRGNKLRPQNLVFPTLGDSLKMKWPPFFPILDGQIVKRDFCNELQDRQKVFVAKVVSLKGTDCSETENWCNFAEISHFLARFFQLWRLISQLSGQISLFMLGPRINMAWRFERGPNHCCSTMENFGNQWFYEKLIFCLFLRSKFA